MGHLIDMSHSTRMRDVSLRKLKGSIGGYLSHRGMLWQTVVPRRVWSLENVYMRPNQRLGLESTHFVFAIGYIIINIGISASYVHAALCDRLRDDDLLA
jgi:hypothetical protein